MKIFCSQFFKVSSAWYRDIDLTVFLISSPLSKASDIKKKDCLLLCRYPNLILSSMLHVRLMIIKVKNESWKPAGPYTRAFH